LLIFAADKAFDRIAHATGGQARDVLTGRAYYRFLLDMSTAGFRYGPDIVDIFGRMDSDQPPSRDGFPYGTFTLGSQAGSLQMVSDCSKPFGSLDFRSGFVF
jgi:hypothetical protein